jgi:hypothetical protein
MVCGIIADVIAIPLCCCWPAQVVTVILGLVALILGYMGMQECDKGQKSGKGMALAGMITGGISLVFVILFIVLVMFGMLTGVAGQGARGFNPNNF